MPRTIIVRAAWDPESRVWSATSDDLPGLVTEAASIERLTEKVRVMIPELLEDDIGAGPDEVPVMIVSEQFEKVRLRA